MNLPLLRFHTLISFVSTTQARWCVQDRQHQGGLLHHSESEDVFRLVAIAAACRATARNATGLSPVTHRAALSASAASHPVAADAIDSAATGAARPLAAATVAAASATSCATSSQSATTTSSPTTTFSEAIGAAPGITVESRAEGKAEAACGGQLRRRNHRQRPVDVG